MPDLRVDEHGFSLSKAGKCFERYSWDEVEKIVAWKRDRGTYDEIRLTIDLSARSEPLELSEEFNGFRPFIEAMRQRLAGVNENWWLEVAFPAFAENATDVFIRQR
jgi:hypothetical protein